MLVLVLRLEVELAADIHAVEAYSLLVEEVVHSRQYQSAILQILDRLDLGLAPRMLYSSEHLAKSLMVINDR